MRLTVLHPALCGVSRRHGVSYGHCDHRATPAVRRCRWRRSRCSSGGHVVGAFLRACPAQPGRHCLPRLRSYRREIGAITLGTRLPRALTGSAPHSHGRNLRPETAWRFCCRTESIGFVSTWPRMRRAWLSSGSTHTIPRQATPTSLAIPRPVWFFSITRRAGSHFGRFVRNSRRLNACGSATLAPALLRQLPDRIVRKLADVLANASEPPLPHPAAPSDLATLIYTSGTTGRPKGVMLSHFALLWNAQASAAMVPPRRDDVFLSVLPLAHAFERTVGYYLPMMGGCTVAYARSAEDLREDFVAIRPTAMLGVPLLYERMSAAIRTNVAGSFAKRTLLRIAASLGWRRFEAAQHRARPGLAARLLWPILKQYVAVPVLAAFGGRLRVAISGGAPLDQDVARLLIGLGLPLVEGYGLTEAAPVVATNGLDDNLPGSVGTSFARS